MGNLSNYYAKTGKKNPFATTSSDTSGGTSQSGGFLRQYQEKNNLDTPFEVVKTKPITPVKVVQAPKPVDNIQSRVTTNASWVGGQVNQNVLQPIANTVKKIGNFTAKLVNPQSTMLKDAGIDTAKMETLKLKPDQKKLAPEQLQKVAGASSSMKPQSKEESIKKAREIQAFTAKKIQDLEKAFEAKKVEPKKLPKGYKEPGILRDQVDSILLGTTSVLGNIGAGIEMEGRKAVANPYDIKSIAGKFFATQVGKRLKDESDNIIASNPEWAEDPNEKLMKDGKPNPRKIARLATGAAPSILVNIAATLITAPVGGWGGLVSGYLMEGGATYKEAKEMGVSEEKAQFYGTTVGIVNSIFEHLMPGSATGVRKLFKSATKEVGKEALEEVSKSFGKEALRQAKKYGINILKNGAIEGSTEAIQEFWSNVIATNYDKNRKVWDNMIESSIGGFLGGGVAGGSTESAIDNNIIVIPDGEHTPQAVIGQVISNGQENTVEGKELIKTAVEAQQKGQNVLIETNKEGEVNSEVQTINQETKTEVQPQIENQKGTVTLLQKEIDQILNVDPTVKNVVKRDGIRGQSYLDMQKAADSGDAQAIANIDKIVELQSKIDDLQAAKQKSSKAKKQKTAKKQTAKEYVETKVKERTTKFRTKQEIERVNEESGIFMHMLEKDEVSAKLFDAKNPEAIDDFADVEYITQRIKSGKVTMEDLNAGYEILEKNGYGPQFIRAILHADDYKINKAKGPKFREDTTKPLTIEDIKAQNAVAKQESAKTGQEVAEDTAEVKMGWKSGDQKREFDAAMSRKNAAKVREMLPGVPEYFKTEFKQEIDEVLNNEDTITLYRAAPKFPSDKFNKGTYFADTEQKARYYAESHYDGDPSDIMVKKFKLPKDSVFKEPSTGNYITTSEAVTVSEEVGSKFRVKDDVKRMTGRTITDAQEQELIDLNRKFMGDDKVSIVLQIMANEKALGKYQDGMIEILDGQMDPKATLMHEIGHKYLDAFSTTEEYVAVLEEGAKKYKTDDFVEVEEQVVERLNEVAKEWDTFNKSVEGLDPITKFLVKVIRRIKIYFANKSAINRLYNDILEGKAAKKVTESKLGENLSVVDAYGETNLGYNIKGMEKRAKEIGYNLYDALINKVDSEETIEGKQKGFESILDDLFGQERARTDEKTAQKTAPGLKTDIPTNEIAQTPVGEGDKTKSKAYTRVYERLAEEAQQDVSYNKLNLEKDTQNALEFITTDPKAAIRVGLGLEEAPTGQTETAISIALADKAGRDGDFALQSQLEASRSLRQTRRGQEIVSERGRFNEDSPHFFIRELMDRRLKNLGSNLKSSLEELQGKAKSVKKAALEKIDKGVSKLKEKIKADRKKIALAQDIIDSIIC